MFKMSFRKRSIRPNLKLSKRAAPISEENEGKSTPSIALKEKSEEKEILTGEQIRNTDAVSKKSIAIGGECGSSTVPGKRLSKRTKVAPKLMQQKKSCKVNDSEINSSLALPESSQASQSTQSSHTSSSQCTVENTTSQLPTAEGNTPNVESNISDKRLSNLYSKEETLPKKYNDTDINMDVIRTYNLLTGSDHASFLNEHNKNKCQSVCNVDNFSNNENKCSSDVEINKNKSGIIVDIKCDSANKIATSTLGQENKLSSNCSNVDTGKKLTETGSINLLSDNTVNNEREAEQSLVSASLEDTPNITDIDSDKKELKHVRFKSGNNSQAMDYNDNCNDYDFQSNETSIPQNNNKKEEDITLKLPVCTETVQYDSMDDNDSLSEGEVVGKQLASKNKVFKPNLDGKRRERLSSFSAYSSCDEEDWQTQKRRKNEKTKDKHEDKEKVNEDQEEKEKNSKNPVKPQKETENVEPKVEKIVKQRKKKVKSGVDVLLKNPEERDLSTLTMQELIYYHPPSFKTVELRSKRDEDENENIAEVDSTIPPGVGEEEPVVDGGEDKASDEVMAPQIMINEDGEIVINQESLTISQKVDFSSIKSSDVVYEDALSYGTHLKRKHNVGKRWKIEETLRFYKALSEIGTDFTLMSQAFVGRFSRNELKKKFKKEEKVNCDLVDRALSNRLPLNMQMFLQGREEMKETLNENANSETITCETSNSNDGEAHK